MKYEVTAEVKTTIDADTAQGAMDYVKHSVGAEAVQSITAVEKENETRSFLEDTVEDFLRVRSEFINKVGVTFVTFSYDEAEVQIPADAFFKAFSSYKVKDYGNGNKCLSVEYRTGSSAPVTFKTVVTEKELDEHF